MNDVLLQVGDVETAFDFADDLISGLVDDSIPVRSSGESRRDVSNRDEDDDSVLAIGRSAASGKRRSVKERRTKIDSETYEGSCREGTLT